MHYLFRRIRMRSTAQAPQQRPNASYPAQPTPPVLNGFTTESRYAWRHHQGGSLPARNPLTLKPWFSSASLCQLLESEKCSCPDRFCLPAKSRSHSCQNGGWRRYFSMASRCTHRAALPRAGRFCKANPAEVTHLKRDLDTENEILPLQVQNREKQNTNTQ